MEGETNKILEAMLLVMEDQRKKMDVHSTLLQQHSELLQAHDTLLRSHSVLLEKLVEGQLEMRQDIRRLYEGQGEMRQDIRRLYEGQEEMRGDIKELTRAITLLTQTLRRHDDEIGDLIKIHGTSIDDLKRRVTQLENK